MTATGPGGAVGAAIAGCVIAAIGVVTWRDVRYVCLFPFSKGIAHEYLGPATIGFGVVFIAGGLAEVFDGSLRVLFLVLAGLGVITFLGGLALGHMRPMEDEE